MSRRGGLLMADLVRPLPVPAALPLWRRVLIAVFGGSRVCRHCGLRYVPCHAAPASVLWPLPADGYCCPRGHEGYTDRDVYCGNYARDRFDYVAEPPA